MGVFHTNANYSIVEVGQNTEKSSGDLRRLAVSQNPVKIGVKKLIRNNQIKNH